MNLSPLFTWRSAIVDARVAPTTKLVALCLSLHMNERGGSCFPSQALLAWESGLTARSVREHLGILEGEGWIVRTKQAGRVDLYEATTPEGGSGVPRNGGSGGAERGSGESGTVVPTEDVIRTSSNKSGCTHKNCEGLKRCRYDDVKAVPMPKAAA